MTHKIRLQLDPADAELILRSAATEAAKYGGLLAHVTEHTFLAPRDPGVSYEAARDGWRARFIRAKHTVEAFGVTFEPTSEAETLTVHFDLIGEWPEIRSVAGVEFMALAGGMLDTEHPVPTYRDAIHREACNAAAERVVRSWRATLARKEQAVA